MKKNLLRNGLLTLAMALASASVSAQEVVTIGGFVKPQGIGNFPLWTYYECSESEFIYNDEDLINLNPGDITKIEYAVTGGQWLYTHMTMWIENTDDKQVGTAFKSTDEMTKVYESDGDRTLTKYEGATLNAPAYMDFEFAEPFHYTGGGLRIHFTSESKDYCESMFNFVSDGLKIDETEGKYNALKRTGYANWQSDRMRTPERQFPIVKITMDSASSISTTSSDSKPSAIYNAYGQKVDANAKGLIITSDGKKYLRR